MELSGYVLLDLTMEHTNVTEVMSVSNLQVCEVFDMMIGILTSLRAKVDDHGQHVHSQLEAINRNLNAVSERVDSTYEALDNRFDSLDEIIELQSEHITHLRERLDTQHNAVVYADSTRPLGEPFLAMEMTGECVELTVYHKFNAEGSFVGDELGNNYRVIVILKGNPHERIRNAMTTPAFVQEFRNQHSNVRGIGRSWVMFSAISIRLAVEITSHLLRLSSHDKAKEMELHTIPIRESELALSFLRSSGEVHEWLQLTPNERSHLEQDGGSFFTINRLRMHLE